MAIRYVGNENYGYVNLVATLFLLVAFADFGLGVVVVNAMSRVKPGNLPTAADLHTVWRVLVRIIIISVSLSVTTFIVAAAGGWSRILNTPDTLIGTNYATAAALSIFFMSMPLGIGQRIMVGLGRVGEMTFISILAPLVTTMATFILAAIYVPPMFLGVAPAVGILVSNSVSMWRSMKHIGANVGKLREATPSGSPERLAHSATSYFIVSLGIPLAMQSDRLILAHLSTASQLSVYSLMAQMYVPVSSVITTGVVALWPAYKQRGGDKRFLWISSLKVLTCLGVGVGLAFGLLSPILARFISSGEIRPSAFLASCFAGLIMVMAIHQASGLLLTDENGLRFQAYCVIALAATSIIISMLLAGPLGAAGAVLASVIAIGTAQLVPGILRARRTLETTPK